MRFFKSTALLQPSGMTHLQLRLGTVSALMEGLLSRHRWSQQLCCCVTSSSYRRHIFVSITPFFHLAKLCCGVCGCKVPRWLVAAAAMRCVPHAEVQS